MLYDTFPRDADPELTTDPLTEVYHQAGASGVIVFGVAEDGIRKTRTNANRVKVSRRNSKQ